MVKDPIPLPTPSPPSVFGLQSPNIRSHVTAGPTVSTSESSEYLPGPAPPPLPLPPLSLPLLSSSFLSASFVVSHPLDGTSPIPSPSPKNPLPPLLRTTALLPLPAC